MAAQTDLLVRSRLPGVKGGFLLEGISSPWPANVILEMVHFYSVIGEGLQH